MLLLSLAECSAAQEDTFSRLAETASPRATLQSFIDACNEFHTIVKSQRHLDRESTSQRPVARRILDCLDQSEIPEYAREEIAEEAAVCLKEILDRIEMPAPEDIPDLAEIEAAGGPEKMPRYHIPGSRLSIGRVEQGPQKDEYLFRPGTVARAKEYYEEIRGLPYRTSGPAISEGLHQWYHSAPGDPRVASLVDSLPDSFKRNWRGLAIWKWVGLCLSILVAMTLYVLTYWVFSKLVYRWGKSMPLYWLTLLLPIFAALIPIILKHFALDVLTIRGNIIYGLSFAANLMATLAMLIVVMALSNRVAETIISPSHFNSKGLNAQFVRICCRLVGIFVSAIVLLEGGQYLGIPITTLLASAGVGGLAVALAAQHALKNLIGTMMLMADKPFRAGDRIVIGEYDGVVENIGLRSTKLRLLNGHLVTLPNDQLAENDVENIGSRPHIRRVANLHLGLDTPLEKIREAVERIQKALSNHEGMDPDFPPRVFFDEFNPDSFNLRIWYWYTPPNYWDYLEFSQRMNLEFYRILKELGVRFEPLSRIEHSHPVGGGQPGD